MRPIKFILRNKSFLISLLAVIIVIVFTSAKSVPHDNESVYLLQLKKAWQPDFLSADWTFSAAGSEHWLFNKIFGFFTLFTSIEVLAWSGRILTWCINSTLLLLVAKKFKLPFGISAIFLVIWISIGQSLVAYSWIFGGFEAKCVSYSFLLAASLSGLNNRIKTAGIFSGLAFSFHPSVGLLGGLALFAGLLIVYELNKKVWLFLFCAALFAVPGIIQSITTLLESQSTQNDLSYLIFVRMPHHLDIFSWPKKSLAALMIILGFNLYYTFTVKRFLIWRGLLGFQIGLALPFIIGIVAAALNIYQLVAFFPFRLFPLFSPLISFLCIGHFLYFRFKDRKNRLLAFTVLGLMLVLPNPLEGVYTQINQTINSWRSNSDSLKEVLLWASENLPEDIQVLAAPWRKDTWYLIRRPIIFSHGYFPYSNLKEWRMRAEDVYGNIPYGLVRSERFKKMQEQFNKLSIEEIIKIKNEYSADYLITTTVYPFKKVYASGEYIIYEIDLN
jgi:hypothetical protein